MSNPVESREPWWAPGTNGGFNQRCVSALTHPATIIALATLLLNDVLFKALWPQAWITGKLSDLAWVIFALPLLAFLLSLCTRGNRIAMRTAFLVAYVGLPLLYAAFNTFEPVHYWILRGLSIASGGSAVAPLDATDSIVIPLGWSIAIWVWRRPALSTEALRLRWGMLVAGVAVLASIATSPPQVDLGITGVGVSEDGILLASPGIPSTRLSDDGGLTWTTELDYQGSVTWGDQTAETPRGRYTVKGRNILLIGADGRTEVVYSTAYLSKPGNVWAQEQSTTHLGLRNIATKPTAIVYDERSNNVVVALGLQGVLVGTPDGQWTPYAVGRYVPTDFSLLGKTRLLLTNSSFLALTLGLALSITGSGLILSQHQPDGYSILIKSFFFALGILFGIGALAIVAWVFVSGTVGSMLVVAFFFLAPIATGVAIGTSPGSDSFQRRFLLGIVIISLLASGYALVTFVDPSATSRTHTAGVSGYDVYTWPAYILLALLGTTSIAASWRLLRYWPAVLLSLSGMAFLIVLAFMLWLHIGIPLALAKLSAIVLVAFAGFLLAGYIKRRTRQASRQP